MKRKKRLCMYSLFKAPSHQEKLLGTRHVLQQPNRDPCNSLSLKLADDANPSRSEPSKLQPSWTPLHSIRCTSSVATMYIRRYVHMFVILVICVYPREHGWANTENSTSRTTNSQLLGAVRSNQTVLCMYLTERDGSSQTMYSPM